MTRQQAFDAKPAAISIIERQELDGGGVRLVVPFQPRGYQKWLLRIPEGTSRKVELDAVGIEVFDMCNGHNSVRQIARRFARQHRVDEQEAEMAVTTFIRMMMRKGLVYVTVN